MIKIVPHPRRIQCDLCGSRDTFMITKIGGRAVQFFTVCRDDLKSLVEEGMKLFGIESKELDSDLMAQLEAKDMAIEQLQQNIAELNGKIAELECKLKDKPKPQRTISTKGKGKKK